MKKEFELTKREYVAIKAMQGLAPILIPTAENQLCPNIENIKCVASWATLLADELLKKLETK